VYEKVREYDSALSYYEKITAEFPKSSYFKKALSHIKDVNALKAAQKPKQLPAVAAPDGENKNK
jgi:hypothetical protein